MWIVSKYQSDTEWVKDYTSDFVVLDKSEKNVGYNIYSMMSFIIDNYDNLPEVCVFVKDNTLQRHITKEEFDHIINRTDLTPLCTQLHPTDGKINYYKDGLYYEVNNYWYANHYGIKDEESFETLIDFIGVRGLPYLGFAPGACWIVPKANILKHPKDFYQILKDAVSYTQLPGEAHLVERSFFHIWS